MAPRLSAGRVQSVAVRLLVERERARISFTEASFWGMKAVFAKDGEAFEAELTHVGGKRVVIGKDFDPDTGRLKNLKDAARLDADAARGLERQVRSAAVRVSAVEEKAYTTSPQAPFVTSTLQQEANRRLRFSARHTMSVAQQLYENGFITYMRTDSTMLSDEAKAAARSLIEREFGAEYLSEEIRYYRTQVKNAQEAHEAIRPAGAEFRPVAEVRRLLGLEAAKLYEMIRRRAVASQMRDAAARIPSSRSKRAKLVSAQPAKRSSSPASSRHMRRGWTIRKRSRAAKKGCCRQWPKATASNCVRPRRQNAARNRPRGSPKAV